MGLTVSQFYKELWQSGVRASSSISSPQCQGGSPTSIESEYCYKFGPVSKARSNTGSGSDFRSSSDS
jgi:hypothetical protein